MTNYAKRTDANHAEILHLWRDIGCAVADTSAFGEGFPDAIIGRAGRVYMCEIKDGSKPPSRRRLTPSQTVFHADWERVGCKIHVIKSIDDALRIIGARAA